MIAAMTVQKLLVSLQAVSLAIKLAKDYREFWGYVLNWAPWRHRRRKYPIGFHVVIDAD